MKKLSLPFFLVLGLALTVNSTTASPDKAGPKVGKTKILGIIGKRCIALNGKIHRLGQQSELEAVAVIFLDVNCPIAKRYAPYLNKLHAHAKANKVELYAVLSDPDLSLKDARQFQKEFKLNDPILMDANGELAALLKPKVVPEAFLLDIHGEQLYRGRIDNRFVAPGRLRATITQHDLKDAITSIASKTVIQSKNQAAIGCVFEAWKGHKIEEKVNYSQHIAPILNANCVDCHRPGGLGPFRLDNFKSAKRRAEMSALVSAQGRMPPWSADPGIGHFQDERLLSSREIKLLSNWAKNGSPRGSKTELIPTKVLKKNEWPLGKPSLLVSMAKPYQVPAEGKDIYRYFVIPNAIAKTMSIIGHDFRPGDSSVVHHCIVYADKSGWARKQDAKDKKPGFAAFESQLPESMVAIGGWAPGSEAVKYPKGVGLTLEQGSDIVLEIHYHLTGKATSDQSSFALYASSKPIEKEIDLLYLGTRKIDIPAGEPQYQRHIYIDIPTDIQLMNISPHMHYLAKSVELVLTLPSKKTQTLLKISNWDFRWQSTYNLRKAIPIPAGSRIDAWFQFDNSEDNPNNPSSPPKRIRYGPQTTDEMCEVYMSVVARDPGKRLSLYIAAGESLKRVPGHDKRGDQGKNRTKKDGKTPTKKPEPGTDKKKGKVAKLFDTIQSDSLLNPSIQNQLLSLSEKEFETLIGLFQTAAYLNPGKTQVVTNYGLLLTLVLPLVTEKTERREIIAEALNSFQSAINQTPKHWEARMGKAMIHESFPDKTQKQKAAKLLIQLIVDQKNKAAIAKYAEAYFLLQKIQASLGDTIARKETRRAAAKRFPKDARFK